MFNYSTIKKIFFQFSPENAHNFVEFAFKNGTKFCPFLANELSKKYFFTDKRLEQKLFGTTFLNPVGMAAGFDKNATMIPMLTALGYGHIEFGTVTPKPQEGNPKPRLFRYPEEESLQNAMGFNNEGAHTVLKNLKKVYPYSIPVGVNIGKNKTTPEEYALNDYKTLIKKFKEKTGCPVLVNTSFNVRGEPIVCSPEDAFKCFMGTEIELLVIGNTILRKEEQDMSLSQNYKNKYELD